jgi:hypothetical protein
MTAVACAWLLAPHQAFFACGSNKTVLSLPQANKPLVRPVPTPIA